MSEFLTAAAYKASFNVVACERFVRFLTRERLIYDGRRAELPNYTAPIEVNFQGTPLESFINEDWPDFDSDGMPYGHPSATEADFEAFPGWVPFGTLGDEESPFLMCEAGQAPCAVAMWEQDSAELTPVADSLDAFLAALVV